MPAYRKVTNFRIKDTRPTGSPEKAIRGSELDSEFRAVAISLNSMVPGSYTPNTNFLVKDFLTKGSADKLVDGAELDAEFAEISTAVASCGGTYTQITDFSAISAGTDVLGDLIQDEFDAIELSIQASWVGGGGGDWGGLVPGTPWELSVVGGTVIFTSADISGAGGTSPRGYNSATADDWIGSPTTSLAAGTLTSGTLAGLTDFGIATAVASGNTTYVRIRVVDGTERSSPQTAYFTELAISPGIETSALATNAGFTTDTTETGFITYKWEWAGGQAPTAIMDAATSYTAVFT